jgi:hypothetical protein
MTLDSAPGLQLQSGRLELPVGPSAAGARRCWHSRWVNRNCGEERGFAPTLVDQKILVDRRGGEAKNHVPTSRDCLTGILLSKTNRIWDASGQFQ